LIGFIWQGNLFGLVIQQWKESPPRLSPGTSNVYINDTPQGIHHEAKPVTYADDTRILVTAKH